ncbi:MAG: winged helix-turn-helix domain-containing protein [Gammaproteobacteria bacterium]|nr:winged helix-turn-helix domain-containing protein [Gammaproteobacteria bacterium]
MPATIHDRIVHDIMNRAAERILATLRRAPGLTKEEIAERAYVSVSTLSGGGYLKTLRREGVIFISGWQRNGSGGFTTPLYSLGSGPDYPKPGVGEANREAPGMARLLEVIEKYGPIDYRQAARLSGLSLNTVKNSDYLDALLIQGKIHISGWRRARNGPMRPVYKLGAKEDEPRLTPLTAAEKSRAFRWRRSVAANASSFAALFRRGTSSSR